MNEIDRVIARTLASEAETFVPIDLSAAERRFLRGRRRRRLTWFGGASFATAAAVVAVAIFPRPDLANEERERVAATVMSTISVGEVPVSIASTNTAVWVANSGDGTVSRIDPDTEEVVATVDIGGTPEEIAADQFGVWVYDSSSRNVLEIDWSSDAVVDEYSNEWPEGTHLDLALKDITLWMADPATRTVDFLYNAGPAPDHPAYVGPKKLGRSGVLPERGGDVALESEGGEVWSYNGEEGTLTLLQGTNGTFEPAQVPDVTDVLTSENGDLAVGGEALWVSDDFGVIMRIDRQTYEKQHIDVGGAWSDLSYGGGYLWALTVDEEGGDTATLRRIDPTSGAVVGEPLLLKDDPVDVSADRDAVWVAHKEAATVTRIDVTSPDE